MKKIKYELVRDAYINNVIKPRFIKTYTILPNQELAIDIIRAQEFFIITATSVTTSGVAVLLSSGVLTALGNFNSALYGVNKSDSTLYIYYSAGQVKLKNNYTVAVTFSVETLRAPF